MIIRHGYRFKLKTTPALEVLFNTMAGQARFVWNKALRLNLDRLANGFFILWYEELAFWLKLWKESNEYGFLAEAHSQILQQKLRDLARAFTDAFDPAQPGKRLPRFNTYHNSRIVGGARGEARITQFTTSRRRKKSRWERVLYFRPKRQGFTAHRIKCVSKEPLQTKLAKLGYIELIFSKNSRFTFQILKEI